MNAAIRLLPGVLMAVFLAAPAAPAAPPAPHSKSPVAAPAPHAKLSASKLNDVFEVFVYTTQRPVRIRIANVLAGKSVDVMWRERMQKHFDYCDRNGDGSLSEKEAGFAFSDQGLTQLLANGFYQPGQSPPAFTTLDRDSDGRATFEEFLIAYPRSAAQVLRKLPAQPDRSNNAAITEAVFKLLDTDGAGKLTQAKVRAAESLLNSHDSDEDECLSVAELVPNMYDPRFRQPVLIVNTGGQGIPGSAKSQIVHVYDAGRIPGTVTQQVIKIYDRDGDFELSRAEIGFDPATFQALDTDGNGRLDGEELDLWRTGAPDIELTLDVAPKSAECKATVKDEQAAAARGFKVKRMDASRVILHVGRQTIDLGAFTSGAQLNRATLKRQYGYLFDQATRSKMNKESITEKDLSGPNAVQFQFLRVLFEPADRNADGKLTRAEFDAYFDLQDSFRNLSLGLTPGVQTPSLFQLIDENGDGRLSVRELRTAWPRLQALEGSDAQVVTKDVIQPAVTLRLTHTTERYFINQAYRVVVGGQYNNGVIVPTKGPLWFRKMDRNGDGDVSRSEFLGTRTEFDAIDTDHDALIGLQEAEVWDKANRSAVPGSTTVPKRPAKPNGK